MTDEEKSLIGKQWAEILMLRRDPNYKDRYQTTWGNKTALGIYAVLNRLTEEAKQ